MHKLMILLALAAVAVFAGCKSIEVDRRGHQVAFDKNGEVVKDKEGNPVVLDLGWNVDYFQHWNTQKFDTLHAKAGEAELDINGYEGGAAASNLTALVSTSFAGASVLTEKIVAAIVSGGMTVAADSGSAAIVALAQKFVSSGGDATKASVTCKDGSCTVTDGSVTCTEQGCVDCGEKADAGSGGAAATAK